MRVECDLKSVFVGFFISFPNFFDLLHVLWLSIAGHQHVNQHEECPTHKGNRKHVVEVKGSEEPHVVDLHPKNHVNLRISSVRRE